MNIKKAKITLVPNYLKIPVTQCNDLDEFNKVCDMYKDRGYKNKIKRTPSGGICIKEHSFIPPYAELSASKNGAELIVIDDEGMFRLQFRPILSKGEQLEQKDTEFGHQSFFKFKEECAKLNIDIDKYAIDNGPEVKKQIPKYLVRLLRPSYCNVVFNNVNHLDLNGSFFGQLGATHKEFMPIVDKWYNLKKTEKIYKSRMVNTIGFMQSTERCKARWAHLAKDAISLNNDKVLNMVKWLEETGRIPLLLNTDGVWFIGEPTNIHDNFCGGWKEDHKNCTLRIKSPGCYEFIEDGKYTPVARGRRLLDEIKPRDKWQWGDIYTSEASKVKMFRIENFNIVKYYDIIGD